MDIEKNNIQIQKEKELRFDNFVNKTIVMSSKRYYKKSFNVGEKESVFLNDDQAYTFIEDLLSMSINMSSYDKIDENIQLNCAIKSLSAIEQAVIFSLYNRDLTRAEAAQILEICSDSVGRIKARAIEKLKKYLEGDI